MATDLPPRPIDLALEPTFEIGGLEVRPATLEVLAGERREQLEPRIMQVLVALTRKRGQVVSRDELIQACWAGRIVGDDSINRCIFRLRRLAEHIGGFEIATVPRVGFRLTEARSAATGGRPRPDRRIFALAGAFGLLVAVGVGIWWLALEAQPAAVRQPRIALVPFQALANDPAATAFSAALADDIAGVMGEEAVSIATITPAGEVQAGDLVLSGTVSREDGQWRVRAYLEDRAAKASIWSARFTRPVAEEAALRDQVAVAVTETLYNVHMSMRQKGLKLDPATQALHLRATSALLNATNTPPGEAIRGYEQVVSRAPRFAEAHGQLAVSLLNARRTTPPAELDALLTRAEHHARLGLKIDRRSSASAYGALWALARHRNEDIATAERDYLLTPMDQTDQPWIPMYACRLQLEVGRAREALRYCQRAIALRPLSPQVAYTYALALTMAGDAEKGRQVMDRMYRYYPTHAATRQVRFELAAFGEEPESAVELLDGMVAADLTPDGREALRLLLRARRSGAVADADGALAALRTSAYAERLDARYLVRGAAILGRPDEAFAAINDPRLRLNNDHGYLFNTSTAALRRDPRFWPVVARLGYVKYWRKRGVWPDFCSDPAFNVDCKREAERVAPSRG